MALAKETKLWLIGRERPVYAHLRRIAGIRPKPPFAVSSAVYSGVVTGVEAYELTTQ